MKGVAADQGLLLLLLHASSGVQENTVTFFDTYKL